MDQIKTGTFLRDLRKEKGLTQEQLAEEFNVTRRSVSRWETGFNMPDLDILMNLSDFYGVDLREILDGERKEKKMDKELEETVKKVAEYSNKEKAQISKRMLVLYVLGLIAAITNLVIEFLDIEGSFITGFFAGVSDALALFAMILGILYSTGNLSKMMKSKKRLLKIS